jgi:hypothetical protein
MSEVANLLFSVLFLLQSRGPASILNDSLVLTQEFDLSMQTLLLGSPIRHTMLLPVLKCCTMSMILEALLRSFSLWGEQFFCPFPIDCPEV